MDAFHLPIPVCTKMWALKNFKSIQLQNIQDECEHKDFDQGFCTICDYHCEHSEIEDGHCLDCGASCPTEIDEDFIYEQYRDAQFKGAKS